MAYTLTLTREERKAIDWIGNRYAHGDDLADVLMMCDGVGEDGACWDDEGDITFKLHEAAAWSVCEIIDADSLACFGTILSRKLTDLQAKVV